MNQCLRTLGTFSRYSSSVAVIKHSFANIPSLSGFIFVVLLRGRFQDKDEQFIHSCCILAYISNIHKFFLNNRPFDSLIIFIFTFMGIIVYLHIVLLIVFTMLPHIKQFAEFSISTNKTISSLTERKPQAKNRGSSQTMQR